MALENSAVHASPATSPGLWARWRGIPLYVRIAGAVVLGLVCGLLLGVRAAPLDIPGGLVLRVLGALAPPLILLAIVRALMHAEMGAQGNLRLAGLLVLNTLVAISIGLAVANVVRPGEWSPLGAPPPKAEAAGKPSVIAQFLDNVPKSLFGPLGDQGSVLSVIFLAVAFGLAFRQLRHEPVQTVEQLATVGFRALVIVLHWVLEVIPLAVFGIVAAKVGVNGIRSLLGLGAFVLAVLLALLLQCAYYLLRIRFGSWVRPGQVLRGTRDALVMAFSTGSSAATMPVTYSCLKDRVGLREQSASMGALVGANFNNDGTALYEAMAALFIAQGLGMHLSIEKQLIVVVTSIVASVGAAGIPEAGLVTMTMVFTAVGLDKEYVALLMTVDWFLDRCRTAVNVMGDINVSCLLDGKHRAEVPEVVMPAAEELAHSGL